MGYTIFILFFVVICIISCVWNNSNNFKNKNNIPHEKPVEHWNIIKQTETEYGIWEKEGENIPENIEVFIASPIKQKDENDNQIIITRWINKKDAIKSIYNVFNELGEK